MNHLEHEYWGEKTATAQIERDAATCKLFATMGGECKQDGDAFIAVIGESRQDGCAGICDTRMSAIIKCVDNFLSEKAR